MGEGRARWQTASWTWTLGPEAEGVRLAGGAPRAGPHGDGGLHARTGTGVTVVCTYMGQGLGVTMARTHAGP